MSRTAEPRHDRPTHVFSSWLFLRLLGVVFLVAFTSFWIQADGLIGPKGVLPVGQFLGWVGEQLDGPSRFWAAPTLSWLGPEGGLVHVLCGGGAALSILLVLGVAPAPLLLLLWAFYLSLTVDGQDFMSFQWDVLLLETAFLSIFLAPPVLRHRLSHEQPPTPAVLWLLRFLLFKLMISSGAVKLTSGDPTWRSLSALDVHYETQPLPTWIGWWAHQLPHGFQKLSVIVMFGIELLVPLLVFAPARFRRMAFVPLMGLQLLIAVTGNYCFFNLLTAALCLVLVDDGALPARLRSRIAPGPAEAAAPRRWAGWLVLPFAAVLVLASLSPFLGALGVRIDSGPLVALRDRLAPFRTVNGYGLFAVMTTTRQEIVIEGSRDGETWLPYEFRWKPGDPARRPSYVAPYQPRLDWQMWFAALGSYESNPWFIQLMRRLLQGSPDVLALLAKSPFPGEPPRYVRAVLYRYHFTTLAERRATGAWWRREDRSLYCPTLSLKRPEDAASP